MITPLAYTPTPEFWAFLAMAAAGFGRWWWDATKERNKRIALERENAQKLAEREEDRKDLVAAAEAAAKLNQEQLKPVIDQLEKIDKAGANRLKALVSSNVTTRALVKEYAKKADIAIETSNGIKTALMTDGVKLITDPKPSPPTDQTDENQPV